MIFDILAQFGNSDVDDQIIWRLFSKNNTTLVAMCDDSCYGLFLVTKTAGIKTKEL